MVRLECIEPPRQAVEHLHTSSPRWALDGSGGGRWHLVGWEPYHGTTTPVAFCGLRARSPRGWWVDQPSEAQRSERCKRCLRSAEVLRVEP